MLPPVAFKLPTHLGVVSYTIYADIKHVPSSFLAAGFGCCSLFQQRIVIYESTPKLVTLYYTQFSANVGFLLSVLLHLAPHMDLKSIPTSWIGLKA